MTSCPQLLRRKSIILTGKVVGSIGLPTTSLIQGSSRLMSFAAALTLLYPVMMLHAGIGDVRTMRIPNRLIFLLLGSYLVAVPVMGFALSYVLWSLAAATAVFALGFLAFSCGWMGGGDVKLLTVAALWLGAGNVAAFIFYTAIFGAMLTILLLVFRAAHLPASWRGRKWISRLHHRDCGVPYGAAIAAAAVLVYVRIPWVAAQF